MRKFLTFFFIIAVFSGSPVLSQNVRLVNNERERKIEVFIGSKPFTTFIYATNLEKPVLFPVYAPNGSVITRGYPLAPGKGERMDHPHQTGLWFNHGAVNGLDFWGNSPAVPAAQKTKCGWIVVKKILKAESGSKGVIEALSDWIDNSGVKVLTEDTKWIFSGNDSLWTLDHLTVLTAGDNDVTFADSKEGLFAIRTDKAFEMPSGESLVLAEANGNDPAVKRAYNSGLSGMYHSSNGKSGDAVWGTRNSWVVLSGKKDNSAVSMAIFDHPSNPGYPAYSHARGYGLFSVDNFGAKAFDPAQKEFNYVIKKGSSVTLRHRFCVQSGSEIRASEADRIFESFTKEYR